jgi:hypothetical protein
METNPNIEGKEVPQIRLETGLSMDYTNQYTGLVGAYSARGMGLVKDLLKAVPFHMQKYEEAYAGYKNIINDKNKDKITRLGELADKMNEIVKDPETVNEEDFRKTCNELNLLIYGDNSRDI